MTAEIILKITKYFSGRGFQPNLKNLSRQKYVNIQENGMQKKNKISSIGKPKSRIPKRYLSLNHQTPIFVNQASQIINTTATINEPSKKAPKFLLNFIFG